MGLFSSGREPAPPEPPEALDAGSLHELLAIAGIATMTELGDMLDSAADAEGELELSTAADGLLIDVGGETRVVAFPTNLPTLIALAEDLADDRKILRDFEDHDLFDED